MGRSEKKQLTRERILDTAKELFFTNGYDATTTEEVAKQADIGVGTLFNYFDSKAELLVEVFSEEFVEDMDKKDYKIKEEDRNREVAELVYHYLYNRVERYTHFSKTLFRDMMGIAIYSFQSKPEMLKKFVGLDFMLVDELIEFLNHLKEEKMLQTEFDSNQAAEIIYSSLGFEFLMYMYQEELTVEDLLGGIRNKIEFILS
ncbi:TetR/AcrR family transcriptional regulator [Halobacillus sp. BBL2006]|uniref:TetR/AcrR family transcriptional regulator n=1 Tax=Halobacillus sp. BBL2006 TaxID=1543706 RepID=UPI00068AA7BB|nr:TetR/AcrR family transcriptional regulator [Halobacillus sp. BBL2006]